MASKVCCPECDEPLPPRLLLESKLQQLLRRQAELESELQRVLVEQEENRQLLVAHDAADDT